MSENPRSGRQERNFTTNVPKILDLKSSSEQIFLRKLSLGAPDSSANKIGFPQGQSYTEREYYNGSSSLNSNFTSRYSRSLRIEANTS